MEHFGKNISRCLHFPGKVYDFRGQFSGWLQHIRWHDHIIKENVIYGCWLSAYVRKPILQIADHFLLKRDRFAVAADGRNLVIWLVGFIAYRWLMGVDTPVGYTLPDMVLTVLLCVLAEKLCAGKKNG